MLLICMSICLYSCICSNFLCEDKYRTLHMVHGNTHYHIYGPHMHQKTTMMRMLWVMLGCMCLLLHKSNPEKMPMCDNCQLQYCIDCIDTHTGHAGVRVQGKAL